MNKIIIIIIIAFVLILCLVGLVFYLTSNATKVANGFLVSIENNRINDAYQYTSSQFKEVQTLDDFKIFIDKYSLSEYESVFWNAKSRDLDTIKLEGNIKTKDGYIIPTKIELLKEDKEWKILNINVNNIESGKETIPSDSDLIELVNSSINIFKQSFVEDDFSILHNSISKIWQSQINKQQLREIFKPYVDKKIDIDNLNFSDPVFSDKPKLDKNNILIIEGYYLNDGYPPFHFKIDYIYEHPNWEEFGIKVVI